MPTLKPRVQVTLEPETHNVIERMAALQGCSRGALIADLVETVVPALARTVALLEAAREAPGQVRQGLIDAVNGLHSDLVGASGDATREVQAIMEKLSDPDWQPVPQGVAGDGNPHVVTRGSGSGEPRGSSKLQKAPRPVTARVSSDKGKGKGKGGKDAGKNG
nr:hypothetical protein [Pseudomonas luteola]